MLLSLSGFLFQAENPVEQLDFVALCSLASSIGHGGVEVSPKTSKNDGKRMLDIVKGMGLVVTCLTARNLSLGGKERDVFFENYLDLCNNMDYGLMKIGSDPEWCEEAAIKAESCGETLARNNYVSSQLEAVSGPRNFLNTANQPNFGLLYDCMHLAASGEDYLNCIQKFFKFTKNILIQSRRRVCVAENGKEWVPALPNKDGVHLGCAKWEEVYSGWGTYDPLKYC